MGCDSSKNQDIQNAQNRQRTAGPGAGSDGKGKEPERDKVDREIENKLGSGKSATDARESEAERFKDIIERTAQNLIDVSQAQVLAEPEQKKKKYGNALGKALVPREALPSPPPLPRSAPVQLTAATFATTITPADKELIDRVSQTLASASRLAVIPCGELVVRFPEL